MCWLGTWLAFVWPFAKRDALTYQALKSNIAMNFKSSYHKELARSFASYWTRFGAFQTLGFFWAALWASRRRIKRLLRECASFLTCSCVARSQPARLVTNFISEHELFNWCFLYDCKEVVLNFSPFFLYKCGSLRKSFFQSCNGMKIDQISNSLWQGIVDWDFYSESLWKVLRHFLLQSLNRLPMNLCECGFSHSTRYFW